MWNLIAYLGNSALIQVTIIRDSIQELVSRAGLYRCVFSRCLLYEMQLGQKIIEP